MGDRNFYLLCLWFIHFMLSNIDWIPTSIIMFSGYMVNTVFYLVRTEEELSLGYYSFVIIVLMANLINLGLSYLTDYQKKQNYCIRLHANKVISLFMNFFYSKVKTLSISLIYFQKAFLSQNKKITINQS